jgi:hypothetical protein
MILCAGCGPNIVSNTRARASALTAYQGHYSIRLLANTSALERTDSRTVAIISILSFRSVKHLHTPTDELSLVSAF